MRHLRLVTQGAAIICRESTGSSWNRLSAFQVNSPLSLQSAYLPRLPRRFDSSKAGASPKAILPKPAPHRNPDEPIYQLTFTCKGCKTRSSHTVSKQGYHHGTVLITCSGCKARHLISDHLKACFVYSTFSRRWHGSHKEARKVLENARIRQITWPYRSNGYVFSDLSFRLV